MLLWGVLKLVRRFTTSWYQQRNIKELFRNRPYLSDFCLKNKMHWLQLLRLSTYGNIRTHYKLCYYRLIQSAQHNKRITTIPRRILTFSLEYDQQIKISSRGKTAHLKILLPFEKSEYTVVCKSVISPVWILWRHLTAQNLFRCTFLEIAMNEHYIEICLFTFMLLILGNYTNNSGAIDRILKYKLLKLQIQIHLNFLNLLVYFETKISPSQIVSFR